MYLYPEDVIIYYKDGKQYAKIDFSKPTIWGDNPPEKFTLEEWLRNAYPSVYAESRAFEEFQQVKGYSISSFARYWHTEIVRSPNYKELIAYYCTKEPKG